MNGRITRRTDFCLMEVVAATVLLGLTLTGAYSGFRLNDTMQRHYLQQQTALQVMDNVVERLAAEPEAAADRATELLRSEFASSQLSRFTHVAAAAEKRPGEIVLQIVRQDHRLLASVRIPRREQ